MLRKLLIRLGLVRSTLLLTLLSILITVVLIVGISRLNGGEPSQLSIVIAVIIPAILAPIYSVPFLRLLIRLDVTEKDLRELARQDDLTGLYNRTYFIEMAEREMERTLRYGEPFSIVILDIDEFRQMNSLHGHSAGDKLLQVMGEVCLHNLRKSDIVARFGGDEFIALLPNTGGNNVRVCVERIRRVLAKTTVSFSGRDVRFTACVGAATYDNSCTELDMILQLADQALHQAKSLGKNQFVNSWDDRIIENKE